MLDLTILTPEKELFQGSVKSVKVPGVSGQFEILENHAAILSALAAGEIVVKGLKGKVSNYKIKSGFVEVLRNDVALLVHADQD
jgi:F-type H+-transporting ATPase subunit epsilon